MPVRAARSRKRGRDLFVRGHVNLAKNPADLAGDFRSPIRVPVEYRDLGSAPRQLARGRFPETRCRAGHDRGHSVDVHADPSVPISTVRLFVQSLPNKTGACRISDTVGPLLRRFITNAGWIGDKSR